MMESNKEPIISRNQIGFNDRDNEATRTTQYHHSDDDIDLAELWRALWAGKYIIITISICFAIASIYYALQQPNIYKASVILAPVESQSGGSGGLAGQFGGLASLAGISLGGGTDKTSLALEVLKSRSFIESFIEKHNVLMPLMASKGWDLRTNQLLINEKIYNVETNQWLREVEFPKTPEPSKWEAYKSFFELLTISEDKATNMITIDIEFYSPDIAKQWLTKLIEDINFHIKEQDKKEAQDSINYLTKKLDEINVSTMENVFYQLIEEQTKNMMLAEVKAEYVLKTIDPPQVPEQKAKPKRALIVVLGTMLGGMLSMLIVLIRYFAQNNVNTTNQND